MSHEPAPMTDEEEFRFRKELARLNEESRKVGTLAELMSEVIEPIRFVVDGLIPEGLTELAGKPKIGKSRLMLTIALGVCAGDPVLGHATEPAEILYIALEDGKRRIQNQVRELGGGHIDSEALQRFHYRTTWPPLTQGGLDELHEWMAEHPTTRLIVVDTLGRFQGKLDGKNRYQEELEVLGAVQRFAIEVRVAVVLIHHLRKQGADDWLEQLSGSQAVSGTADTILGLFRERGQMDATLRLVSREVEEKDLALKFDGGRWESMGDAAIYRQSVERTAVLEALESLGEASPSEIAPVVDKTSANVSKMLVALHGEGLVQRVRRGTYSLTPLVDSVEQVDNPLLNQPNQPNQPTDIEEEPCSSCRHPIAGAHRYDCSELPEAF